MIFWNYVDPKDGAAASLLEVKKTYLDYGEL